MRVALLTWDYPPVPTGLGRAASEIAEGLIENGAEPVVFTLDRTGYETFHDGRLSIIGCAIEPGTVLHYLRQRVMLGHLAVPLAMRTALLRQHRLRAFDLIEATNWYAPAALSTRLGIPVVIRNSTPAIDAMPEKPDLRTRLDLGFAHSLERRTARLATSLISNTEPHARLIEDLYMPDPRKPHHVIGLSLSQETIASGRASPFPASFDEPVLTFVGRAERRKGFDEVLSAFDTWCSQRSESGVKPPHLHLVGLAPGDLEARIHALNVSKHARRNITNHLRAEQEILHRAISESHAVLAPSRYESYGLVYREAAAYGRPLIASSEDPSARDFISSVNCGVLAQATEASAIHQAMTDLFADRQKMLDMRRAGLIHAATLSRQQLGAETLDVYQEALAAPCRTADYKESKGTAVLSPGD